MTNECKTTLKWTEGSHIQCRDGDDCFKLALKSPNGEVVGMAPTNFYTLSKNDFIIFDLPSVGWTTLSNDGLFARISKNAQDKLELGIFRKNEKDEIKLTDLQMDAIKLKEDINLEQYLNIEQPQIYIMKLTEEDLRAYLYDIQEKKVIGNLADRGTFIQGNSFIGQSVDDYSRGVSSWDYKKNHSPDVIVTMVDGKYQFEGYGLECINNLNYNAVDKAFKNNPYCHIEEIIKEREALCKELDETQLAMDETHHPCTQDII